MAFPSWLTAERALGAVSALLVISVPGAYTLAFQLQQGRIDDRDKQVESRDKEIESLTMAKTWNVPDTINRLSDISKSLHQQFASMDELKTLRKENEGLRAQLASLTEEDKKKGLSLQILSEQNQTLKKNLDKTIVSDQVIDLQQGQSAQLIKNNLVIGVDTVYPGGGIYGRLGNQPVTMGVGETKELRALGKDCRLTLASTAYPRASFSFSCF
ncbi:hypothetical protein [Pseudomonas sp. DG56-2]|uniref:hypothetical protein n=1 Tax=Pseudomonas sp. DG56-2 TaxID=2320270 RepID=UPI0010A630CC|nr:hypothetical protein [Pseudomonas sp. DG56-2]